MTNHQQFIAAMKWVEAEQAAHELTKKALASVVADCERFKGQLKQLEQSYKEMNDWWQLTNTGDLDMLNQAFMDDTMVDEGVVKEWGNGEAALDIANAIIALRERNKELEQELRETRESLEEYQSFERENPNV
jgi:hypothetical protein